MTSEIDLSSTPQASSTYPRYPLAPPVTALAADRTWPARGAQSSEGEASDGVRSEVLYLSLVPVEMLLKVPAHPAATRLDHPFPGSSS